MANMSTSPIPDDEVHVARLDYTVDDNGIWLRCSRCDFERPLGFGPSLSEAITAWGFHPVPEQGGR